MSPTVAIGRNRSGHIVLKESMSIDEILKAAHVEFPGVPDEQLYLPEPYGIVEVEDDLLVGELRPDVFDVYNTVWLTPVITLARVIRQLDKIPHWTMRVLWTRAGCFLCDMRYKE